MLGRLARVENETTPYWADLAYDATGHRFRRQESTGADTRYFGEWVEHRGGQKLRLVHGAGIDEILGEIQALNDEVRAFVPELTQSVSRVVINGALSAPRRYEAFGKVRSGTSVVERGYAGRPTEGATGLVYLRARHYDPATGRFLQTDALAQRVSSTPTRGTIRTSSLIRLAWRRRRPKPLARFRTGKNPARTRQTSGVLRRYSARCERT